MHNAALLVTVLQGEAVWAGQRDGGAECSAATLFVSASMDGTVRLWTGQGWGCLRIFTAAAPTPFIAAALSTQ